MTPTPNELVAMEAVLAIVRGINESRDSSTRLARAEETLSSTLANSASRTDFLVALAKVHEDGSLSTEAYRRLLSTAARVLKSDTLLIDECRRIVSEET